MGHLLWSMHNKQVQHDVYNLVSQCSPLSGTSRGLTDGDEGGQRWEAEGSEDILAEETGPELSWCIDGSHGLRVLLRTNSSVGDAHSLILLDHVALVLP